MDSTHLTPEENIRYNRHILLPEIGKEGQFRLKKAAVLLIGAGGLGSAVAFYLAGAGIGHLGIADPDTVSLSNLQRQILHGTDTLGESKVESATKRLNNLNPDIQIIPYSITINSHNIMELIKSYDIVVDGSDNFPTRYLVNDACILSGKPYVYGAIHRFEGQASLFIPGKSPCYRCIFPEPPEPGEIPSCSQTGVLGVLPGLVGIIQATETIKWICQIGDSLVGRLIIYDALSMRFRELKIPRNPKCALCGNNPTITQPVEYHLTCPDHDISRENEEYLPEWDITPREAFTSLQSADSPVLVDIREPVEWAFNRIQGAIHIPLSGLLDNLQQMQPDQEYILYCHSGVRSHFATQSLHKAGFEKVKNLLGGIDAWSVEIDSEIPRY